MSSFFCSVRKLNLGLLETSVSSVGEKLKNLLAFRKKFMNLTSEAANKIGRRFSIDICYDDEKLQALTGLVVEIVGLVRSVKLKEAFRRCISKTKFFQNLLEDTENSMNQAKKFSDNFSQKFSKPLLKSKPMIDTIIEQVTSTTSTLMRSFFCSARKLNPSLENFASSLVEKLQNLSVCGKKFMSEAANKIGHRFGIDVCHGDKKPLASIGLVLEIVGFVISAKKKGQWGIRNTFFRICWPGIEEFARENIDSFLKTYFKRLAEDEKTRAKWVNTCVEVGSHVVLLLILY